MTYTDSVAEIIRKAQRKDVDESWKLTEIEYITKQQMFDLSDIGKPFISYQAQHNADFEQLVRRILPHLSPTTMLSLTTKIYFPIFNGMKLNGVDGYYTQHERWQTFLADLRNQGFVAMLEDHFQKSFSALIKT